MNNVRKAANGTTVDCAVFQDQLPSLFESGEDLTAQEHLKTCENCSALVRDLEYIAEQAKLLLPIYSMIAHAAQAAAYSSVNAPRLPGCKADAQS